MKVIFAARNVLHLRMGTTTLLLCTLLTACSAATGTNATEEETSLVSGSGTNITNLADQLRLCRSSPQIGQAGNITVWMVVGSTNAQLAEVEQILGADSAVTSYQYVDAETTYEQFKNHNADDAELVDLISSEHLPTSFLFETVFTPDTIDLIKRLEATDGVNDIETATDADLCGAEAEALKQACETQPPQIPINAVVWLRRGTTEAEAAALGVLIERQEGIVAVTYVGVEHPTRFDLETQPLTSDQADGISRAINTLSPAIDEVGIVHPLKIACKAP